jgi:hypothetical protein
LIPKSPCLPNPVGAALVVPVDLAADLLPAHRAMPLAAAVLLPAVPVAHRMAALAVVQADPAEALEGLAEVARHQSR